MQQMRKAIHLRLCACLRRSHSTYIPKPGDWINDTWSCRYGKEMTSWTMEPHAYRRYDHAARLKLRQFPDSQQHCDCAELLGGRQAGKHQERDKGPLPSCRRYFRTENRAICKYGPEHPHGGGNCATKNGKGDVQVGRMRLKR